MKLRERIRWPQRFSNYFPCSVVIFLCHRMQSRYCECSKLLCSTVNSLKIRAGGRSSCCDTQWRSHQSTIVWGSSPVDICIYSSRWIVFDESMRVKFCFGADSLINWLWYFWSGWEADCQDLPAAKSSNPRTPVPISPVIRLVWDPSNLSALSSLDVWFWALSLVLISAHCPWVLAW